MPGARARGAGHRQRNPGQQGWQREYRQRNAPVAHDVVVAVAVRSEDDDIGDDRAAEAGEEHHAGDQQTEASGRRTPSATRAAASAGATVGDGPIHNVARTTESMDICSVPEPKYSGDKTRDRR